MFKSVGRDKMKSVRLGFEGVARPRLGNLFVYCLVLLLVVLSCSLVNAQGLIPASQKLQSVVLPTDLAPSKPYSPPGSSGPQFGGSSETVPFSSEMVKNWLPIIPNLQFGFNYLFGRNLSQSWWSADYVLPVSLTRSDIVFGEAHLDSANSASTGDFPFLNNFWQQGTGWSPEQDRPFVWTWIPQAVRQQRAVRSIRVLQFANSRGKTHNHSLLKSRPFTGHVNSPLGFF